MKTRPNLVFLKHILSCSHHEILINAAANEKWEFVTFLLGKYKRIDDKFLEEGLAQCDHYEFKDKVRAISNTEINEGSAVASPVPSAEL